MSRLAFARTLVLGLSALLLSGCFGRATRTPDEVARVNQQQAAVKNTDDLRAAANAGLTALKADPELASRAPEAIQKAEAAVAAANDTHSDAALNAHLAYLADRRAKIARARAENQLAQDRHGALVAQRDAIRSSADVQAAQAAQEQARQARAEVEALAQTLAPLRAQLGGTRLSFVVDEVLMEPGKVGFDAALSPAMDALANDLAAHPEHRLRLEGHSPGHADDPYVVKLSRARAEGLKTDLVRRGAPAPQIVSAATRIEPVAGDGCHRCVSGTLENLAPPVSP